MSQKEIKDIVKSYDKDGDGTVDVEEFLQKMSGSKKDAIHKALVKRSGIRKQFEKYDKDGNGYITSDEFRKVVEDRFQCSKLDSKQRAKMMKDADKNGDGKIDYEEFLKSFTYIPVKLQAIANIPISPLYYDDYKM